MLRSVRMMRVLVALFSLSLLAACSNHDSPAPVRDAGVRSAKHMSAPKKAVVADQPLGKNRYRVKAGDTLYAIAWLYGLDFQAVARFNSIDPPYPIYAGQILKLDLDDPKAGRYVVKSGDNLSMVAKNHGTSMMALVRLNDLKKPYTIHPGQLLLLGSQSSVVAYGSSVAKRDPQQNNVQNSTNASVQGVAAVGRKEYSQTRSAQNYNNYLTWQWPTRGRIAQSFSLSEQGNKGLDIAGTRGQAVVAAAAGKVVYAGSALRGYGNLIIIKHNEDYLSAYAHNDVLRVQEQQEVKAGQRIADMGSSDSQDVRLHFEIRYRGQSINPVRFLPKR
jgi:lipoprotein NlpD